MIVLALSGLLMAAQPEVQAASDPTEQSGGLLALPSADEDIRRALFQSHAQEPDRRVCTVQILVGSRQPRRTCGTLREWFAARTPSQVAAEEAPWQLVEEIKKQRRKVNMRSRG